MIHMRNQIIIQLFILEKLLASTKRYILKNRNEDNFLSNKNEDIEEHINKKRKEYNIKYAIEDRPKVTSTITEPYDTNIRVRNDRLNWSTYIPYFSQESKKLLEELEVYNNKNKILIKKIQSISNEKNVEDYFLTYYQNKQDFVKLENGIFVINDEGYLNLTSDEIAEIKQLQALNNLEIFTFPSSTSTTTLYKKDYTKRALFLKRYYKFAFQLIIQKFCEIGFIFAQYNIKNFCINQQKGLMLWEHSDMRFYSNTIKHILRCDKCYKEVEYYFENFFSSSSEAQESEFICPNCGEHYTYSKLKEIYEKNCEKSYK